jgi:hypothetical protein
MEPTDQLPSGDMLFAKRWMHLPLRRGVCRLIVSAMSIVFSNARD